jgi:hypothetical protein
VERDECELPVPISERPDDNMTSGSAAPRRSVGIARGSNGWSAYPVGNIPSCAMSDIATNVAAAIQ